MQVLAADDRDVFGEKNMLAETLLQLHHRMEAEVLARQAFEGQLRTLGPQHSDTLYGLNRLGRSLAALGRYDEAKALYTTTFGSIGSQPNADPSKGCMLSERWRLSPGMPTTRLTLWGMRSRWAPRT